jgi:uncharacterized protein YaaN involved in tellurite resistance
VTLLDAVIFVSIVTVPIFIIAWYVPMPKHHITIIRERNEEIQRLTALVSKYEAELHTYRDSLTKLESDNFCLIEQLNHAIAFGDAEKSAKIAKYEAAIDEHKRDKTFITEHDHKLWQTREK